LKGPRPQHNPGEKFFKEKGLFLLLRTADLPGQERVLFDLSRSKVGVGRAAKTQKEKEKKKKKERKKKI